MVCIFFIDGIGEDPVVKAQKWAIAESWDNDRKTYSYNEYSVLKCDIMLRRESILNLTTEVGLNLFNKVREKLINELEINKLRANFNNYKMDFKLFKFLKKHFNVNIIIAHVYIKFSKERQGWVKSRIPNCTIMSVGDENLIDQKSILEVEKGGV